MKRRSFVLLVLSMVFFIVACGQGSEKSGEQDLKIGLVLNLGGLGDKSFNDSAFAGLTRAKNELGIDFKYVEPDSLADFDTYLVEFAEANYDLVIALGHDMKDPLTKVAVEYPETHFTIVDSIVDLNNVTSIVFNEKEGSFLGGYMAALVSESNKVGFIGAMDIPSINNFYIGYEQGAKFYNPNIEVYRLYVGGGRPFNDPVRAKELAISLYNNGVDVIYSAAGGSGRGMLEAVRELDKLYAIGVDSNQDMEVEGKVLTSVLKRVDNALYQSIIDLKEGKLTKGVSVYGIKEGGVGLTNFEAIKNGDIDKIDEIILELKGIEERLISGKITIN